MDNDKRKVLVLGVLGAALLGVGAFQLIPKGEPAPAASASKPASSAKPNKAEQEATEPQPDLLANLAPSRDPFAPVSLPLASGREVQPNPAPVPTPPPAQRVAPVRQPRVDLAPLSPLPGALPGGGGLGGVSVVPTDRPLRQPGEFAYSVVGVVVGEQPVVVLRADDGTQRMIPLGGGVDGDSRVLAIEEGRVTVQHRGKRLTLPVGGNSNAK